MFVVVCYDIPSDRRRDKVAQTLKGFGYRVQESVFECEINAEQFSKMKQRLTKKIHAEEDSVRYYSLCADCLGKIEICGPGDIKREKPFFVV